MLCCQIRTHLQLHVFFFISIWSQAALNLLVVSPVLLHLLTSGNTIVFKQFHWINRSPDGSGWQIWSLENSSQFRKVMMHVLVSITVRLSLSFHSLNSQATRCECLGPVTHRQWERQGRVSIHHVRHVTYSGQGQQERETHCSHWDTWDWTHHGWEYIWAAKEGQEQGDDLHWEMSGLLPQHPK